MKTNRGNTMFTTAIVIAVVIVGIAIVWSVREREQVPAKPSIRQDEQEVNSENGMREADAIQNAQQELLNKTSQDMYQGQQIAGVSSPYLSFTQQDYDDALAEGKIVFLDFYANWCPICRAEASEIQAGFEDLMTQQVVGFRVNYKDDETDSDEKALAEQFDIPYQHTKVILNKGQEVARSGDSWDKERFLEEINKVL